MKQSHSFFKILKVQYAGLNYFMPSLDKHRFFQKGSNNKLRIDKTNSLKWRVLFSMIKLKIFILLTFQRKVKYIKSTILDLSVTFETALRSDMSLQIIYMF